ncbi:hypothetical protein GLOTRDRAFT_104526 [Gloeophyllum trabeum ATCC 11539]|uniref:Osmotin thaumatin-like protein n=1 Tax=Gloeophyllum trabeum (strain ATCC 11539 / FP-39264 / Madison 617) TaxID=670483 RepID=S7RZ23_GLOTA|nr:uncharacterized protein GLOTRDRAFT_104526 [Gloeophyllum trabeum ATCC 11539]EPQ58689.1 hypothetical protein GLOTRDRAFT_104526 [Gloeophyllum trabeum ATCC 11539]
MPKLSASILLLAFSGYALAQEYHQVSLTNNCGTGTPVFRYEGDTTPQGSTTVDGPVIEGVAWLNGLAGDSCLDPGGDCSAVEFTLQNEDTNTAEIRDVTEPASFTFVGGGACNGLGADCPSPSACTSTLTQCVGDNAGIHITFC